MSARTVVTDFWKAMRANDWDKAALQLAPECVIDWPWSTGPSPMTPSPDGKT